MTVNYGQKYLLIQEVNMLTVGYTPHLYTSHFTLYIHSVHTLHTVASRLSTVYVTTHSEKRAISTPSCQHHCEDSDKSEEQLLAIGMESEITEPSRQGWMRTTMSKMSKINKWADRYFVLHGPVLYYYLKNTDTVGNHFAVREE